MSDSVNLGPYKSDPLFLAAEDLMAHTDPEELVLINTVNHVPSFWTAIGSWTDSDDGSTHLMIASGFNPIEAVMGLCTQVIDGSKCLRCERVAKISSYRGIMPLDEVICWVQFDPELKVFRRGCEGQDA